MRRRDSCAETLALLAGLFALKLYLEGAMHQPIQHPDHGGEAPPTCPKCRGPVLVRESDGAKWCNGPCQEAFFPSLGVVPPPTYLNELPR